MENKRWVNMTEPKLPQQPVPFACIQYTGTYICEQLKYINVHTYLGVAHL